MDKTVKQAKLHAKFLVSQNKERPWLNLSGIWLEQAGFGIGQKIEITVMQKELVIKVVE